MCAVKSQLRVSLEIKLWWQSRDTCGRERVRDLKPGLKDGRKQFRLVVDLRPLNLHCKEFRTRYQTLASLSEVILEGEEVAFLSFDLMSAYHSCAIAESDRKYFGFLDFWQGMRLSHYYSDKGQSVFCRPASKLHTLSAALPGATARAKHSGFASAGPSLSSFRVGP